MNELALSDLLYFYRIRSWQHKICGWRPILYTFFAYAVSGVWDPYLYALNTLAWLAPFLFFGPFDDYYDYRIERQDNFINHLIAEKNYPQKNIIFLIILSLFFVPFAYIVRQNGGSQISFWLYFITFVTVVLYALPPVRFKVYKLLRFISAPFVISLLFLQSYLLLNKITPTILCLVWLIILFQSYAEVLHRLDELKESSNPREEKFLMAAFLNLPIGILICSIVFVYINPIFIVSVISALIRVVSSRRAKIETIACARRKILHPVLSLYDFMVYALLGSIKMVQF